MKKIAPLLLCLMLVMTASISISDEPMDDDYTEVALPGIIYATVNETVNVSIYITPQNNTYIDTVAVDNLYFTAGTLEETDFEYGNLFTQTTITYPPEVNNTSGEIDKILWGSSENTSSPGYLCYISFKAKSVGIAYVNLTLSGIGVACDGNPLPKIITSNCTIHIASSQPPVIFNPSPSNGEENVSVDIPNFNVQISDPDGDNFQWSIEISGGVNNSSANDTDGTKFAWFWDYLEYNKKYTVWVNVTENTPSALTANAVYNFTTGNNTPPTVELIYPENLTDYLSVYNTIFNCTVTDSGPEDLTVKFYINDTFSEVIGTVNNASEGVVNFNLDSLGGSWWLTHYVTHSWYVTVDDGVSTVQSETWTFFTSAAPDINEDRVVNYLDVSSLVAHYLLQGFLPGEIGEDIIEDGIVNYLDVSSLVAHYLNTY